MEIIQNHKSQDDFIKALRLTKLQSNAGVFILSIDDISEDVAEAMELYRNEFYEVNLIKNQSNFKYSIDGRTYHPQGEPYMAFVAPSQLQTYQMLGDDPDSKGYLIYINKETVKALNLGADFPFFRRDQENLVYTTDEQIEELFGIAISMEKEFRSTDLSSTEILKSYTRILLLKAKAFAQLYEKGSLTNFDLIARFEASISKNFRAHKSVHFYAQELGLSSRQLANQTNKAVGKSPLQIIHDVILHEAKALMSYSDLSTSEIAYQLGFEEVAHFSRFFKKSTGETPSHYQLVAQNGNRNS